MADHRQRTWVCPLCRAVVTDGGANGHDVCDICQLRPVWEALPRTVRDEIGPMIDADGPIRSGYQLAELDGHRRPTMEYMKLASYRGRLGKRTCSCAETDYGHVSWTCPSCDRPLLGCGHNRGEICAPCGSRPGWEALPQAVRDEVGAMTEVMSAAYRLRDLDHNRLDVFDYTLMAVYQNSRNSSGSIPRNAS
ncbi:hypothetical protein [Lentzea sp. NPDC004782]|uniref:hypothetical protein n=1 Tax=Lentzea sp. NPDC004782 TaxID=3154458 RepID=UPI0033B1E28A